MTQMRLTRRALTVAAAVVAGVLLGAVFGQTSSGRAATAVPKNTSLPVVSGTAEVGNTLTTSTGKWTGDPTTYTYAWSRCDASGKSCAAIADATAKIYTVTTADVGHTLRATVKATNAGGSASAQSAPTALVPPNGCPPGTGTIDVASLEPPARLSIGSATITPPVVKRTTSVIDLRFQVTACGGRPVQGATVFATAIPFNQFDAAKGTTNAKGTVSLTEVRGGNFPAARKQSKLAVFARATKPGEKILGGVSTRRLFSFHVARS